MNQTFTLFAVALTLSSALALNPNSAVASEATIKIDGSSTVFPITEAVAEEFQKLKKGAVRVTVGISGTGGGFKKFCRGETDVQDASRPISKEEMAACKASGVQYFELPIAFDAITVAVSHSNTWANDITIDELKKLWEPAAQGQVKKWNQIRPSWPDAEIKLFGAGSDSGTFDYFTEAVVGKAKSSRGDFTASEDDNTLIQGIAGDKNSLGYVPFAYYSPNQKRLKALGIVGGAKAPSKKAILPSSESVEHGVYFPLSRPIFIYVSAASAKRTEVKEFTEFYLQNGAELASQVKYVQLPKKAYLLGLEHFRKGSLGTAFNGEAKIGMKVEQMLKLKKTSL